MAAATISFLREQHAGLRAPQSREETWTPRVVPYTKLCPVVLPALGPKGNRARTQLAPILPILRSLVLSVQHFGAPMGPACT